YYTETSGGSDYTTSVAACDSSEFVRELYNGRKIILARGYSIFESSTYSSFFSEVTWVARDDLRTLTTMLMEDCEHRSLVDLLGSEGPDMILVDGSLTGRLMHGDKEFRADRFEGFPSRYYDSLLALLKMVAEKGTVIAFVSKSSESRSLISRIMKDSDPVPEESEERTAHIVDHVLIKSLAKRPGYSKPVLFGGSGFSLPGSIWTFHLLPSISDLPMKIDFLSQGSEYDPGILRMIVDTLFWAYSGQKVYNIWLSKVDNMVKFRTEEVEKNLYAGV
ncbi:serotonin receptor related protein, partial [mine drainage metagenome]